MPSIIREEDKSEVENLIKAGANKDKIEGYLLFSGYSKKDSIAYLKELGLVGKVTFRTFLYAKLLEGYYSIEEFESDILKYSDNTIKHLGVYNNERILGNSISAKYDPEIKSLVENERPLKGPKAKKGDNLGSKDTIEFPTRPKTASALYKKIIGIVHPDKSVVYLSEDMQLELSKEANANKDNKYKLDLIFDKIIDLIEAYNNQY